MLEIKKSTSSIIMMLKNSELSNKAMSEFTDDEMIAFANNIEKIIDLNIKDRALVKVSKNPFCVMLEEALESREGKEVILRFFRENKSAIKSVFSS